MEPHKIWAEQCEAARNIEADFGTQKALNYLIDEKYINYLEAAETNQDFRNEIPSFVAEIKTIFEPWQLAQCLSRLASDHHLMLPTTKMTPTSMLRMSSWSASRTFESVQPSC